MSETSCNDRPAVVGENAAQQLAGCSSPLETGALRKNSQWTALEETPYSTQVYVMGLVVNE